MFTRRFTDFYTTTNKEGSSPEISAAISNIDYESAIRLSKAFLYSDKV